MSYDIVTAFLAVAVAVVGGKVLAFRNLRRIEVIVASPRNWKNLVPFVLAAITMFAAIEYWRVTNGRYRPELIIIMYIDVVVVSFSVVALDGYAAAASLSTRPGAALNATLRNATFCFALFLFLGLLRYVLVAMLSKIVDYEDILPQISAHLVGVGLALAGGVMFHCQKNWFAFVFSTLGLVVILGYLISLSVTQAMSA